MNTHRAKITLGLSGGYHRQALARQILLVALLAFGIGLTDGDARATSVSGLYGAVVNLDNGASAPSRDNFDEALSWVLVKVTGFSEAESAAARARLFPNSSSLVQRYSLLPDEQVQIDFDPVAVRKVLDGAGMPVWGSDRPLVAVWLAVDSGGGQRYILSGGSGGGSSSQDDAEDDLRVAVEDIADSRGLPIVLPLVDAQDLSRVSFSDLWGDFRDPVVQASQRYGAEAVLIGRARSMSLDAQGVRWTLVAGGEQAAWQGNVLSGPAEAAAFLARRLATYADSAGSLLLRVTGVDDMDKYGQLVSYFRSLNIVESTGVSRVDGDSVEFELVVRGDAKRLATALNGSRLIVPVKEPLTADGSGRLPDMVYAWPASQ